RGGWGIDSPRGITSPRATPIEDAAPGLVRSRVAPIARNRGRAATRGPGSALWFGHPSRGPPPRPPRLGSRGGHLLSLRDPGCKQPGPPDNPQDMWSSKLTLWDGAPQVVFNPCRTGPAGGTRVEDHPWHPSAGGDPCGVSNPRGGSPVRSPGSSTRRRL